MKHDVFISYSRKDTSVARLIYETLMENNVSCFMDTEDISGGQEFSDLLAEEIENSSIFLFLGSANSYAAKWTIKELHFAIDSKDKKAILPYCIDNAPIPRDIRILISDLNIRNIQEHPIETVLLKDVQLMLEKLAPKAGKEDLPMVRTLIADITSSQHSKQYNIELLTNLGKFNWNNRSISSSEANRPKEAKEYFLAALGLLKHNLSQKEFGEDRQVADLYQTIADIEKYLHHTSEAEKYYCEAVQRYRKLRVSSYVGGSAIECLLKLIETRIALKEYDLAEKNCLEAKEMFSTSSRSGVYYTPHDAQMLCELWGDILKEQGRKEDAIHPYDEVLALFRDRAKNDKKDFPKMLSLFAQSNIKYGNLAKAELYLKEATTLTDENLGSLLELARLYEMMGKQDDAVVISRQCFKLVMKRNVLDQQPLRERLENIVGQVVPHLDKAKLFEEAEECYQLALSKFKVDCFGDPSSCVPRLRKLYESYADWLFKHNRYAKALSYIKLLLPEMKATTASHVRVVVRYAQNLFMLGMENEATKLLNTTLDNARASLVSPYNISDIYYVIKGFQSIHFNSAAASFKQFLLDNFLNLEIKDKDAQASYFTALGWFLMLLEEYDQARKPLEKALELSDKENRSNALNNLGRLYASIGLYDEAEKLLREAFTYFDGADKKDSRVLAGLAESQSYMGLLYLNQGNPAAATVYLEQALSNYKEYSRLSDSRKEDIEQTEQWLEKAKANL